MTAWSVKGVSSPHDCMRIGVWDMYNRGNMYDKSADGPTHRGNCIWGRRLLARFRKISRLYENIDFCVLSAQCLVFNLVSLTMSTSPQLMY
jgi:hypothetical protein